MPTEKSTPDFGPVFAGLKEIFAPYAKSMAVMHDTPDNYCLNSMKPHPTNGQPMMFAAVRTGKHSVSFHSMPIYCAPALQASLSPALRKRMQGKACFNFAPWTRRCSRNSPTAPPAGSRASRNLASRSAG